MDEPLSGLTDNPHNYYYTEKIYTSDQQPNYDLLLTWRQILDKYEQPKYIVVEAFSNTEKVMKYYQYGVDFPFNLDLITNLTTHSTAADIKHVVDTWCNIILKGGTPNWVVS